MLVIPQTLSRPSDVFAFAMTAFEVRLLFHKFTSHTLPVVMLTITIRSDLYIDPSLGCSFR